MDGVSEALLKQTIDRLLGEWIDKKRNKIYSFLSNGKVLITHTDPAIDTVEQTQWRIMNVEHIIFVGHETPWKKATLHYDSFRFRLTIEHPKGEDISLVRWND